MANRKVTLVANCKTEQGWRRYPVAWGRNGRIKPGTVIVSGKEWKFTEGNYQVRAYQGSRMVYKERWRERTRRRCCPTKGSQSPSGTGERDGSRGENHRGDGTEVSPARAGTLQAGP